MYHSHMAPPSRDAWPGARLVRLSGVGHRKALVNPAVHRDIVGFVQENVK